MDVITVSIDMNLRKLGGDSDGQKAWCAAVQRVAKSQAWLCDSTTVTTTIITRVSKHPGTE